MMRRLFPLISLIVALYAGCAHKAEEVRKEAGFTIHPLTTFIRESTGETGLFIEGEDWHCLFDLSGLRETDEIFTSPGQFISRKGEDGLRASVHAEKIPAAGPPDACAGCYLSRLERLRKGTGGSVHIIQYEQESGRKILIRDGDATGASPRDIFYYPCHKGYCFDFHLTVPATDTGITKGIHLVDSIKFVGGRPPDAMISRYFNIWSRRLLLTCPGEWRCSLKKVAVNPFRVFSIILEPDTGNGFRIQLSPVEGFKAAKVDLEKVKESAVKCMTGWEGKSAVKPVLQEMKNGSVTVFYFDATDRSGRTEDGREHPFVRQGCAYLDGSQVYFTIYCRDQDSIIAQQGLKMLAGARITDLP